MNMFRQLLTSITLTFLTFSQASAEILAGSTGSAAGGNVPTRWCTAWFDLAAPRTFQNGDVLCVGVLGQASVFVRLLPMGGNPGGPMGVVGGQRPVPQNQIVAIPLTQRHDNVVQVSVHGCDVAWGNRLTGNEDSDQVTITRVNVEQDPNLCR